MNALGAQLPSLVALAAHAAICVTGVSVVGATALWICRNRSAPLRHALALSFLAATLVIPAMAAPYQYRLFRFDVASPAQSFRRTAADIPNSPPVVVPVDEPTTAGTSPRYGPNWSFIACAAFAGVWGTGIAIGCVRAQLLNRRQRQYLASLWPVTDAAALELAGRLRVALGIGRHVQLRSSRDAPWPFTVGLFRPSVVIPAELLQEQSRSHLEAVLIHEFAHVLRLDCGIAGLEGLARLVCWWNPLVATLASQLAASREEICDAYVLAHSGDGTPLAQYLLRSAEKAAHAQIRFAIGLSLHDAFSLRKRITQLLRGDRNTMIRIGSLAACVVVLAALVFSIAITHANYAQAQLTFGTPVSLGPIVNWKGAADAGPSISADGLTLYFESIRNGPSTDIMMTTRDSRNSSWHIPVSVPGLSTVFYNESDPSVTSDGLLMFFFSENYPGVRGNGDILQSTRSSVADAWSAPVVLGSPINTAANDRTPGISPDGLTLYFASDRAGGEGELDLYVATRSSRDLPFGEPTNLGLSINSGRQDDGPDVSADGLLLMFHSTRNSVALQPPRDQDIFYSQRSSVHDPWGPAQNLGPNVNTAPFPQSNPNISDDGKLLYYTGWTSLVTPPGGSAPRDNADLYVVDIIPEPSTGLMCMTGCILLGLFVVRASRKSRCGPS